MSVFYLPHHMVANWFRKVKKITHWSVYQPGVSIIGLVLTIGWFIVDFFSMESVVGVFATAALLIQHYSEVPKEIEISYRESDSPLLNRAVWVGAKKFDLSKANPQLFEHYRDLVNCKTSRDLFVLRKNFSRKVD